MGELRIVFSGFPDPEDGCVFIEVEDAHGRSINAGQWRKRADGYVELVVLELSNPDPPEPSDDADAWSGGIADNH